MMQEMEMEMQMDLDLDLELERHLESELEAVGSQRAGLRHLQLPWSSSVGLTLGPRLAWLASV